MAFIQLDDDGLAGIGKPDDGLIAMKTARCGPVPSERMRTADPAESAA